MKNEERKNIVSCLGEDRKNHLKINWKDTTLCGTKSLKFGFDPNYYSCGECDYFEIDNDKNN